MNPIQMEVDASRVEMLRAGYRRKVRPVFEHYAAYAQVRSNRFMVNMNTCMAQ
jgi:hypothetical protein